MAFLCAGTKQKWVPISIELPKSNRAQKNWQARHDQPRESGTESGRSSSGAKDDAAHFRHRDDGQATGRKSGGSPSRRDKKDYRDVSDRGGKDRGRPNSASTKALAAHSKKGKVQIILPSHVSTVIH